MATALPDFGEELADVLIYLAGLAQMTGIDLGAEVGRKLAKNAARSYQTGHDGVLRRSGIPHDSPPASGARSAH